MFETTRPLLLLDHFRVPHTRAVVEVAGIPAVRTEGDGPALFWSTAPFQRPEQGRPGSYLLGGIPIFGALAPEEAIPRRLALLGGTWRRDRAIRSRNGVDAACVWRRDDGSFFLPFDPNEIIANYLSERYKPLVSPALVPQVEALARQSWYRARPFLPRSAQMRLRRSFSRVQARAPFPRWPIETALHDFFGFLFSLLAEIAAEPIPTLAPWPNGFRWALVLTHDVEGAVGHENLLRLLEVELRRGYRSSWNFVPEGDRSTEDVFVQELRHSGFEVGVHGLHHDGRDLASARMLKRRLPRLHAYADRWQAVGFRSPGTLRSWELMPLLGFDYDSSYSDTAPFEPQPGGCCSWLPYMIKDLVELPITLPQDHTLFELLGHRDGAVWSHKTRFLRDQGGMALMLTHPDYIGNRFLLAAYEQFLDEFADDETAWRPLARDVSSWWRRRAATTLRRVEGAWEVEGPARGEAVIELAGATPVAV
jgi:hypothetical protein